MKLIIMMLFFILFELCNAQQNTLKDYFPLSIGNKWNYSFSLESSSSLVHSAGKEEGILEYEIIGKTTSTISTIWNIFQRRDFTRSSYISYHWYYESIKDSSTFSIVEIDSSYHELYTTNDDPRSVFPFIHSNADSSKLFRYKNLDLPAELLLKIEYKDPDNPSFPSMDFKYNFNQKADVGITQLIYSKKAMLSSSSAKYYLNEFIENNETNLPNEEQLVPTFSLSQNYPNPFNPMTKIQYSISQNGFVTIKVYDLMGNEITTLINENKEAGSYQVEFDGTKLSSGVYLYKLQTGNSTLSKKMLLLK